MNSLPLVDPELRPLLDAWPTIALTPESLADLRARQLPLPPAPDSGVELERRTVSGPSGAPDITLHIYRPRDAAGPLGCIYHIHGGGYVGGSAKELEVFHRPLAAALGCVIVSVDYRLAPETVFPGAIEDCYAGLAWTFAQAEKLGIDPARIGVMGESAGGGLAAALALMVRDRGEYALAFQHLTYPMIDDRTCTHEPHAHAGEFIWTPHNNRFGWAALLGQEPGSDGISPYAAAARADDLSGLPPTFVMTGALDLFVDEDIDYAKRLIAAIASPSRCLPRVRFAARTRRRQPRAGGTARCASPGAGLMATRAAPLPATGLDRALPSLFALTLAMAIGFSMMGSFATVQESVKADLRLSDTVLGVIQGASAALALVVFSIPVGILVDRVNRVRLMIALALVWTLGTALTAVATGTIMLFAARVLTATGTTGALTAALSLTADLCLPAQRGRAMLLVNLGKTAGVATAFALGGWLFGRFASGAMPVLADLAPWRATHAVLALLSLVLILPLLLLLLREPVRREVAATIHAPTRVLAGELWSRSAFLIPLFVGQVAVVMADNAALVWAAPVLSRHYGLQPGDFAGWMGALILVSGLGGTVLGGFAADIGQKSGVRGGLLVGALVAAMMGVPAALFPIGPTVTWFAIALGLLTLCGAVTGLITSVALTVLLPNELRGLCIGAFTRSRA